MGDHRGDGAALAQDPGNVCLRVVGRVTAVRGGRPFEDAAGRHEHGRIGHLSGGVTRILQGTPGVEQQQAELGAHERRIPGRHVEECGVEELLALDVCLDGNVVGVLDEISGDP